MKREEIAIEWLKQKLYVCRFPSGQEIGVKPSPEFFCLTYTDEETSVVCTKNSIPAGGEVEGPWRGFRVKGELDFSLVGILAEISSVLAEAEISIFAISTYNTDYILVKAANYEKALMVLDEGGFGVEGIQ